MEEKILVERLETDYIMHVIPVLPISTAEL